jgi:hypothetical protein
MQSFLRVSRSTHTTVLRTVLQANSNSPTNSPPPSSPNLNNPHGNNKWHSPPSPSTPRYQQHQDCKTLGVINVNGCTANAISSITEASSLLDYYNFDTKYDPSTKKYLLIGLGSEVLIELCAEALFFEQISHEMFGWTLNAVQGKEYMRRRLGRHIMRKGNKYGLWVDEDEGEAGGSKKKCTIFANYMVEGERGCAKIVMQVEQEKESQDTTKKLVLLLAEFSTGDKYVIFELDEKPQLPAM